MADYFKFWLAKELVPLAFIAGLFILFATIWMLAWLNDTLRGLFRRKR